MSDVPLAQRGLVRHSAERFGTSRGGRPLEVFGPLAPGTPLVLAAIHGNESETTVALSAAIRTIAACGLRWAVVLAANPDGALLGTRGNLAGVDLNRNFPPAIGGPERCSAIGAAGRGRSSSCLLGPHRRPSPSRRLW